jgi:hypothetical protein
VKCPSRVVVVELLKYVNEDEVRDVNDNLPTLVMEFVAETVNTHCLTRFAEDIASLTLSL